MENPFESLEKRLMIIEQKLDFVLNYQQMKKPTSETWIDVAETCTFLKISKRTLQRYRDNGVIPFSQVGDKIYFKTSDIDEHLNKHYIIAFKKW